MPAGDGLLVEVSFVVEVLVTIRPEGSVVEDVVSQGSSLLEKAIARLSGATCRVVARVRGATCSVIARGISSSILISEGLLLLPQTIAVPSSSRDAGAPSGRLWQHVKHMKTHTIKTGTT